MTEDPKNRPTLLILSYSHLYRDARVLRQIAVFREIYDVTTMGYGQAPDDELEHIGIPSDIIYWKVNRPLVMARFFQLAYDRSEMTRYVRQVVQPGQFDVILANDVHAVPVAITLKPTLGVHADLHEYTTRQQEEMWRYRTFLAPYYGYLIRRWVTQAASATTVGAALAKEYKREFGLTCGVVFNAPGCAELAATEVGQPIRLVHAGGATPARLETILAAMDRITSDATLDLYLVDVGSGYASQVAARYADHPRVRVHDAVPTDQLVATLNRYDVGIHILPPISFNHRYAMPNKLFDYIQARLGVLVGPNPEMAATVTDHGVGWVTADFSPENVAKTIDSLSPATVAAAKAASNNAASTLCAEQQVAGWTEPLQRLTAGH